METQQGPEALDVAPGRPEASPGLRRLSLPNFLVALVAFLLAAPFLAEIDGGDIIDAALLTLVLSTAVLAVGGRKRSMALALFLVTPAIACTWIRHLRPDLIGREVPLAVGAVFVVFVMARLFLFVLRAPTVDHEVLCAAIAVYLLLGLLGAFIFVIAEFLSPGSFAFTTGPPGDREINGFTGLYLSFVTLSTVGYGDIVPVSRLARVLALLESTTGMFYITVLIARLVSLYSSARVPHPPGGGRDAAPDAEH